MFQLQWKDRSICHMSQSSETLSPMWSSRAASLSLPVLRWGYHFIALVYLYLSNSGISDSNAFLLFKTLFIAFRAPQKEWCTQPWECINNSNKSSSHDVAVWNWGDCVWWIILHSVTSAWSLPARAYTQLIYAESNQAHFHDLLCSNCIPSQKNVTFTSDNVQIVNTVVGVCKYYWNLLQNSTSFHQPQHEQFNI